MNHVRPATAAAVFAFEKNTLSIKQYVVIVILNTNKNIQIVVQSEWVNTDTDAWNILVCANEKNR